MNNSSLEKEVEWRMGNAYNSSFEWLGSQSDQHAENLGFGLDRVNWGDETFTKYMNRSEKSLPRQSILFKNWEKNKPSTLYIGGDRSYGRPGECVISQARGVKDSDVILYTDHKMFIKPQFDFTSIDHSINAFNEKKPVLVWRGNSTGGTTEFQKRTGLAKYKINRRHFCETFSDKPYVDAKIATVRKNFMHPSDQNDYKYILSLEGNDSSSNPRWIFSTNSVSFMPKQHTSELTWHYHIKPWEHYVPFEYDLSDVKQKIEWCEAHPGECYDIIQHANEVFKLVTDYNRERQILQLMFERINRNLIHDEN